MKNITKLMILTLSALIVIPIFGTTVTKADVFDSTIFYPIPDVTAIVENNNKDIVGIKRVTDRKLYITGKKAGVAKITFTLKDKKKTTLLIKVKKNELKPFNRAMKITETKHDTTNKNIMVSIKNNYKNYQYGKYNYFIYDKNNKLVAKGQKIKELVTGEFDDIIYLSNKENKLLTEKGLGKVEIWFIDFHGELKNYTQDLETIKVNNTERIIKNNKIYLTYTLENTNKETIFVKIDYILKDKSGLNTDKSFDGGVRKLSPNETLTLTTTLKNTENIDLKNIDVSINITGLAESE